MPTRQIVGAIKRPAPISELVSYTDQLTAEHGPGLVLRQHGAWFVIDTGGEECWCIRCDEQTAEDLERLTGEVQFASRMNLCPDCGNKRCPRATHHDHACTRSNAPGQPGSAYA